MTGCYCVYYIQTSHPPKILVLTRPTTHRLAAAVLPRLTPLPGSEPNQRLSKAPRGTESERRAHTQNVSEVVSVNTPRSGLALCQDSLRRIFLPQKPIGSEPSTKI